KRELLQRSGVDVRLPRGLPTLDHALPRTAVAVAEVTGVTLGGRLPDGADAHAHPEPVERDVADVDAGDRLVGAVEEDRRPDVRVGLLLSVVLHRSDDGERAHRATVGDLDVVGFGHLDALEVVVAVARDVYLAARRRALTDDAPLEQAPREPGPVRVERFADPQRHEVLGDRHGLVAGGDVLGTRTGLGHEVHVGDGALALVAVLGGDAHARRHRIDRP